MDKAVNENFVGHLPGIEIVDAGPFAHLPAAAPLDMPEQDFSLPIERPQPVVPKEATEIAP